MCAACHLADGLDTRQSATWKAVEVVNVVWLRQSLSAMNISAPEPGYSCTEQGSMGCNGTLRQSPSSPNHGLISHATLLQFSFSCPLGSDLFLSCFLPRLFSFSLIGGTIQCAASLYRVVLC